MAKKNAVKGLLISILIPIIIVVMIAGSFVAVINSILEIITGVVTAIVNFFEDPIGTWKEWKGTINNAWDAFWDIGKFDKDEFYKHQMEPKFFISLTNFEQMSKELTASIDREKAGLDDITLKKMLLTYYRTIYTNKTTILIELTPEEYAEVESHHGFFTASMEKEDEEADDSTKKPYLKVMGAISLVAEDENGKDKELIPYTEEGLKKIYNDEYLKKLPDTKEEDDYAIAVRKFLTRSYATDGKNIKMYSFNTKKEVITYQYGVGYHVGNEELTKYTEMVTHEDTLQTIPYIDSISQYTTPVEFFVNLMEVAGSKEYINALLDVVNENCKIVLKITEISCEMTEETNKTYTQNMEVTGQKEDVNYEVYERIETSDGYEDQKIDLEKENMNIYVSQYNSDGTVDLNVNCSDNYKINVVLYVDGKEYKGPQKLKELEQGGTETVFKRVEDPSPSPEVQSDSGKIKENRTVQIRESQYDIGIQEVNTWYVKLTKSIGTKSSTKYYTRDKNGEEREITKFEHDNPTEYIETSNEDEEYTKDVNPNMFVYNENYGKDSNKGRASHINKIYSYITDKKFKNREEYDFTNIEVEYPDDKECTTTIKETIVTVSEGATTKKDNTDKFLALLSNSTGKYSKGATFKAKNSGGIPVRYESLYSGTSAVGELLENGAETIFELLDSSYSVENDDGTTTEICNTVGLSEIMKYVLFRYSGINYGVSDLNFDIFNTEGITYVGNIIGQTDEEKIWCSLLNKGYSEFAIAGVMGNVYGKTNSDRYSNILFNLPSLRSSKLQRYAEAKGLAEPDINTEIEFLLAELSESGGAEGYAEYSLKTVTYIDPKDPSETHKIIYNPINWKNATSPEEAAETFYYTFLHPSTINSDEVEKIKNKAKEYYEKFQGKTIEDISGINEIQLAIVEVAKNSGDYGIQARSRTLFSVGK